MNQEGEHTETGSALGFPRGVFPREDCLDMGLSALLGDLTGCLGSQAFLRVHFEAQKPCPKLTHFI